jgi:hypothetical protein
MSYDLRLTVDRGGPVPTTVGPDYNYTSNCGDMFELAIGRRLLDLDGMPAVRAGKLLRAAVERMRDQAEVFAALNPDNGWGDSLTAREWLEQIADSCVHHPQATVRVTA